ncbi:hypothetical protein [Halalkalicoccus salilacus]|uniref:hypothetical protein n=1 Tax=Halalkalicoccus salilacus TaxID=3117459 RepID=UPI00300F03AD
MKKEVATTVRAKLHSLTGVKRQLLHREYDAFQRTVSGDDVDLYSATKQQAGKVRKQKNPRYEQPIVLRNDVINVVENDRPLSKHWVKVPVFNPEKGRGDSIWCPVEIPEKDHRLVRKANIGDSELVRRNGEWYVHLVCKRAYEVQETYSDVLAIDMGARWIATSVALSTRETTFYGSEVRRIREHYKQIRKSIGKAKVRKARRSLNVSVTPNPERSMIGYTRFLTR